MKRSMSKTLHFFKSDYFPENYGDISENQHEDFYQDISSYERARPGSMELPHEGKLLLEL